MTSNKKANNLAKKYFSAAPTFIAGVTSEENLPTLKLPEFAFAGKSNVGKSSLINAVTNNSKLARTSNTPGRTQQINFFQIGDKLTIADMPGYGYAKVSKSLRSEWDGLMVNYLKGRPNLCRAFILVDSRRGLKDHDKQLMDILDSCAVQYFVILTKEDEISDSAKIILKENVEKELVKHPAAFPKTILTSSKKKTGIDELRNIILNLI